MMYQEIIFSFYKRELKTRYYGSFLGSLWIVVYPIIMAVLSTGILGMFFEKENPTSLFLHTLIGTTVWFYFFYGLLNATRSLVKNREIISSINFNWAAITISEILIKLFDFSISLILFLVLFFSFHQQLSIVSLFIPLLIVLQTIFLIGLGLITSTLYIFFKDTQTFIEVLLQITYLLTPIIYPISIVPSKFRLIVELNPLTNLIELYRQCLFSNQINIINLEIFTVESIILLFIGLKIFNKYKYKFPESI